MIQISPRLLAEKIMEVMMQGAVKLREIFTFGLIDQYHAPFPF